MLSASSGPRSPGLRRVGEGEHRRQDREVLGDVVRDRERRQRAARDQQLLADLDDLDQLRRVGVEVDHVAGLLRGGRAGVHRHADVGLRERRRVVRAVAGHRDHPALRLLLLDQRHLRLGRRLGEEVVDAGLLGDLGGGDAVVAGDHHRADAHPAQLVEALAHAALDDVLEVDDAEHVVVPGDDERRAALRGRSGRPPRRAAPGAWPPCSSTKRLTASAAPLRSSLPLMSTPLIRVVARERDEGRLVLAELALAQAVALLREHDDRAALRRLVGERGELRDLGELALARRRRPG